MDRLTLFLQEMATPALARSLELLRAERGRAQSPDRLTLFLQEMTTPALARSLELLRAERGRAQSPAVTLLSAERLLLRGVKDTTTGLDRKAFLHVALSRHHVRDPRTSRSDPGRVVPFPLQGTALGRAA